MDFALVSEPNVRIIESSGLLDNMARDLAIINTSRNEPMISSGRGRGLPGLNCVTWFLKVYMSLPIIAGKTTMRYLTV